MKRREFLMQSAAGAAISILSRSGLSANAAKAVALNNALEAFSFRPAPDVDDSISFKKRSSKHFTLFHFSPRYEGHAEALLAGAAADPQTIDLHFALGSLFRRRGEVDRAIRIHQNLAARDTLSPAQREQAALRRRCRR